MPVFKSGKGLAPKWCEMEYFEILRLQKATTHRFDRIGRKEKLIIGKGECCIAGLCMFPAVCSDCGKPCQVPFLPVEGRPVRCDPCFQKHRAMRENESIKATIGKD